MRQQNRQRVCKEHQEVIGNKMHFCFGKGFMMVGEVVGYRGDVGNFPSHSHDHLCLYIFHKILNTLFENTMKI